MNRHPLAQHLLTGALELRGILQDVVDVAVDGAYLGNPDHQLDIAHVAR